MTDVAYTGAVAGALTRVPDANFRVGAETVNSAWSASFLYDDDSLLVQAGDVVLGRDPASGRVDTSTAGVVTEEYGYNDYGEVTSKVVTLAGSPPTVLVDVAYVRDDLGRIQQKIEQVDIDPVLDLEYEYDDAGRLRKVYKSGYAIEYYEYASNGNRTYAESGSNGATV